MKLNKKYQIDNVSIDEISNETVQFLNDIKMESKNQLRIRLLVEEILLEWQEYFSKEVDCSIKMGISFGRPYISMELQGESYNPLDKNQEEYGAYRDQLMANMGLAPIYSYERGCNKILFRLKKQKVNPIYSLAIAVALGSGVGLAGMILPDALRVGILDNILTPIYDTFFNLLGTIAGPMVFLSVAWGIYGIGDTATFGRIGKRMILHFIGMAFVLSSFCTMIFIPFFRLNFVKQSGGPSQLSSLFQMILGFIPTDIVTPFQDGNSMQIIFLGAAIGVTMLILGKQTEAVVKAIEQINFIVQFLMELISNMVPFFIFIILVQMIWSGTLGVVLAAWKPVLVFLAAMLLLGVIMVLGAAIKCKVSPVLILKKGISSFFIGVSTASSVATFGNCSNVCEKKYGIKNNITSFGVPLGIVMFPPATAIYFILICIYTAEVCGIECSLAWFVLAIFSAVILSIASPPIPGGTLTCYTIMFVQLGLPEEALVVALALDVVFDFVATGMNMFTLQQELLIQAKGMDMVREKVLRETGYE
jgi:Na+/H+-dicarboxylate symporter